ncbi:MULTISPECIES: MFS transporter [unclassified Pseudoxanthomonas]|uniref:MFS transporter n=1 Tax=unclassified Pseudoxanthomonas TaxID=2645906 RepID=UPI00161B64F7|nr:MULTISPECIES: MFS transporter [unclassified Pseudoxanthomonas]MBB3276104.1 DHA2 family multidrug resistance protein-like MFS transporter [Pseudoxanthomonas sp. OG2]MBV7472816.1 MFS transporter [Pseudoxanthomonas sp. PXM05]
MISPTSPKATRREWIGLAAIALPCMVYAMDLTVLNLALPAISAELNPSTSQLLWIVDIYGFLVAGFLITMGTLGDRIGRRRLLLIGAAAFAAASIIAAFSRSAEMLIAMRALLGVAGATLAPSTMSLIRNMFHDEHERQFAIGVWIASFSVGGAIGPLVGGLLLEWFWWGAAFLAAVPVMVLLLLLGPKLLPEYRDPDAGRLDPASMAQSLFAVLAVVYGLKRIAEYGADTRGLLVLAAGLVLGVLFVRRQRHLDYPFLDVTLFRRPAFSAAIVAYALAGLSMMGVYIFMTQYLQLVLGLSPLEAGFATVPWSLCFTVGSLLAPKLARHWGARRVMVRGLLVAAVGFGITALVVPPHGLWILIAGMLAMSIGMAPVFTVGNELIITTAPPERAGAASALAETSAELSGALGIALLGSAGMALYRFWLEPALPADLAHAAAGHALSTLGGAIATAETLPAGLAIAIETTARAAFTDAMRLVAVFGGTMMLLAAWMASHLMRDGEGEGHVASVANEASGA